MHTIVVPIDLSPITKRTLDVARIHAQALRSKVWLIHVAAPDPDFVGYSTGPEHVRDNRALELRKEHVGIQELAKELQGHGVDAEGLLVQGPTSATILEEVIRLKADLIIMGSHGHGALYRTFVGSVSGQVLEESQVPVLIVPSRSDR